MIVLLLLYHHQPFLLINQQYFLSLVELWQIVMPWPWSCRGGYGVMLLVSTHRKGDGSFRSDFIVGEVGS